MIVTLFQYGISYISSSPALTSVKYCHCQTETGTLVLYSAFNKVTKKPLNDSDAHHLFT